MGQHLVRNEPTQNQPHIFISDMELCHQLRKLIIIIVIVTVHGAGWVVVCLECLNMQDWFVFAECFCRMMFLPNVLAE